MVGSLQHKEGRKKREREGRKEGEGKADGENWNLMFRSLLFGKEERRGPDSSHGLQSEPSGPGHLNSPFLILLFA